MKCLLFCAAFGCGWLPIPAWSATIRFEPGRSEPPPPAREFRGAWVATVNNIDWPSKLGLTVAQQKAEWLAILEWAVQLRLNAVIFQVRPACDALYASKLEPWSEYLTGEMGRAPQPLYDPLKYAVEEAHRRGLELHAWFNPYRARHSSGRSPVSATHISRAQPQLVRPYGRQLWLDPGQRAVQDYSLSVILDVVRRYDIDGVHLDDYFYPYPERSAAGAEVDFPDEASWGRYAQGGGILSKGDWRRDNVNTFVRRLYQEVKGRKPWVKVGLSPFGIWRPGFPSSVRGFDAYEKLYADSRHWLANGWLDYCAPQLYWTIDAPQQGYLALLQWWREQNPQRRHIWPGNSVYRASAQPGELAAQVKLTRRQTDAPGNLLWSMKPLRQDKGGVASDLARNLYDQPALVPACPWLDAQPPAQPSFSAKHGASGWTFSWRSASGESAWLWVLQRRQGSNWKIEVLPGSQTSCRISRQEQLPNALAIRAVDRCGNWSAPAVLQATTR